MKYKWTKLGNRLLIALLVLNFLGSCNGNSAGQNIGNDAGKQLFQTEAEGTNSKGQQQTASIDQLTNEKTVVRYLKEHRHLPDYFITKKQARQKGWIASKGNLCDVLPGKAIGGDHFSNREGRLPKKGGRKYFEADINYHCGRRNAERVIFSNDGLIFITKNHYKSFQKQ